MKAFLEEYGLIIVGVIIAITMAFGLANLGSDLMDGQKRKIAKETNTALYTAVDDTYHSKTQNFGFDEDNVTTEAHIDTDRNKVCDYCEHNLP